MTTTSFAARHLNRLQGAGGRHHRLHPRRHRPKKRRRLPAKWMPHARALALSKFSGIKSTRKFWMG